MLDNTMRGRRPRLASAAIVVVLLCAAVPALAQTLTDSLYTLHHPRLIFSAAEVPSLRMKVSDGGDDDDAYAFLLDRVRNEYPNESYLSALNPWYGVETIPDIGLVAHLESPPDSAARALGRTLTLYIANSYGPDFDEAHSGMRLRSLALGYDLFFSDASESERAIVRDEIVSYIQVMVWNTAYELFRFRPYLGNHSAMFAAALGLAAIAVDGEAPAYLLEDAIELADHVIKTLIMYHFDPGGAFNEGALYAVWTMKSLVFYFEARERFDGYAYADEPRVRAMAEWLPYELLTEGYAHTHNLNDSPYQTTPLAANTTYLDWAMYRWQSGLAAWLWEHVAGDYGVDLGAGADKAATALWHQTLPQTQPDAVLPLHRVFLQRGLYHFRTGWQTGNSSDDVLFSFYSGKFQGGHAQEDQNQFSLYAYGEKFVIDHGSGGLGAESEAHNMVFIDGAGQHNTGGAIGTDGRVAAYLLGGLADYVQGDASAAYGTYSEFNRPDYPIPGSDWSWGYSGANPVLRAHRHVLVVHGGTVGPYFLIVDDIDKDGAPHDYQWRMHTLSLNNVDITANPMKIEYGNAIMDMHLLHPAWDSVAVSTEAFNNGNADPNATLIKVDRLSVNPRFSLLLAPRPNTGPTPAVSRQDYAWGRAYEFDWGGGTVDYFFDNVSGAPATHGWIESDGRFVLVREVGGSVEGYLATDMSYLNVGGTPRATIANGTATCEFFAGTVHLDRYDADFAFYNDGVTAVFYHDQPRGFVVDGDYVVAGGVTAAGDVPGVPGLEVRAYPNPFNPSTTIVVRGRPRDQHRVAIYDVAGRELRRLWEGPLEADARVLTWDGRNQAGGRVASGVYFVRVVTPAGERAIKITLLK